MSGFGSSVMHGLVNVQSKAMGHGAPNWNIASPTLQSTPTMPSMNSTDSLKAAQEAMSARLALAQRSGRVSTMMSNISTTDKPPGSTA